MKVVAIAFSDLHLHKFRAFAKEPSSRLDWSLKFWAYMSTLSIELGRVPVLFMGDLFHSPKELENEVIMKSMRLYFSLFELLNVHMYAISGNHDMDEENFITQGKNKLPSSYLESFEHFKTFHSMDFTRMNAGDLNLHGIPYLTRESDFLWAVKKSKMYQEKNKLNILMVHQDFPGAITPEGMVLTKNKWDDNTFDGWDLILSGHIHKPQVIWAKSGMAKGWMMGSPIHQTAGDIGVQMGYYLIYDNGKVEFKNTPKEFPSFRRGEPKNDKDYWIPLADEVLDIETEDIVKGFNIKDNSRKELATKYLMEKGIKSKFKKEVLIKILNNAE